MATSSAPDAIARVTTVCPLSQCTLVPLGCLLRDLQPSLGPRATSEPVDGRVQGWTRLALDSFKGPPTQFGPWATSEPVDGRVQAWTRLALDSFKGPPTQCGPRATSEPVDGRVQAWTRLAQGHVHRNVCERIGRDQPTRMGEGKSQRDPPFLWLPF